MIKTLKEKIMKSKDLADENYAPIDLSSPLPEECPQLEDIFHWAIASLKIGAPALDDPRAKDFKRVINAGFAHPEEFIFPGNEAQIVRAYYNMWFNLYLIRQNTAHVHKIMNHILKKEGTLYRFVDDALLDENQKIKDFIKQDCQAVCWVYKDSEKHLFTKDVDPDTVTGWILSTACDNVNCGGIKFFPVSIIRSLAVLIDYKMWDRSKFKEVCLWAKPNNNAPECYIYLAAPDFFNIKRYVPKLPEKIKS